MPREGEPAPAGWRREGPDWLLEVKAVPGASRDEIAGWVDGRLKVRVKAPPEAGRANAAVCALVADWLGLKKGRVTLETGAANPRKLLRIQGAREGMGRSGDTSAS